MRGRYVIIPAGGTGSRMGSELPKQMLDLCGKPVLRRTVELFLDQPFEVRVIVSINDSIPDNRRHHPLPFGAQGHEVPA